MKKQEYEKQKAKLNEEISAKKKELSELREEYISTNLPAPKGTLVEIVLDSGRVVRGEVKDFAIMQDGDVYVTAYKDENGGKMKYISKPYKKLTIC